MQESIEEHKSKLGPAVAHYYVGCIEQDEGKDIGGRRTLSKSSGIRK